MPVTAIPETPQASFVLSALKQDVPNPYHAAFLHRGGKNAAAGKRWVAQNERRSVILATTRKLMAEHGDERVSLRFIADHCEISLQTIYNIVGDRSAVLREALVEYVHWTAATAITLANADSSDLFVLLEMVASSAVNYPDYNANAARFANAAQAASYIACRNALSAQMLRLLTQLQARGMLRAGILTDALAWQMTELIHVTVCRWTAQPYDATRFRRDLAYGPSLMLLGALHNTEAAKLDERLHDLMSGYAARRAKAH